MSFKPELLAPAGNLEKLKVAVLYGADAVYFSGQKYGMRAGADNFSKNEIITGVSFAKNHNVKTYVTLNAFLHDEDFDSLAEDCKFLEEAGVNAVIVSDLGVISHIRKHSGLEVHLSTQSSCLNLQSAKFWKSQGLERLVLGREVSIADAGQIKKEAGIEIELFIHGAMCMAYSGNCVISNYTAGRDSNRGGCIQSCRFNYKQKARKGLNILDYEKDTHFISSKDMNAARLIPEFIKYEIDSLKIEGRMKSLFYVATTCRAYRQAIDEYMSGQASVSAAVQSELDAIPHRDYFEASFEEPAPTDSSYQHRGEVERSGSRRFVGLVIDQSDEFLALRVNTPLAPGQEIEFLPFRGNPVKINASKIYNIKKDLITSARQDCVLYIPKEQAPDTQNFTVVRSA